MADSSRDEPFDRLLKRRLASEGPGGGACPDAELLAAFAEGRLSGPELRTVEHHAASCARCTHIVALTAATETDVRVPEARSLRFGAWRWAVPLATAATVAGLLVLTRTNTPGVPATPATRAETAQTTQERAPSAPTAPEPSASAAARANSQAKQAAPIAARARSGDPGSVQLRRRADSAEARADAAAAPPAAGQTAAGAPVDEQVTLSAPLTSAARFVSPAMRVLSPDPQIMWQVRDSVIERSTDSGKTWTIEYTADRRVLTGRGVTADVAWMGGERGLLLRRSGAGWSVAAAPSEAEVVAIEAATASEATVRLADGRTFLTTDSGVTWAPTQ